MDGTMATLDDGLPFPIRTPSSDPECSTRGHQASLRLGLLSAVPTTSPPIFKVTSLERLRRLTDIDFLAAKRHWRSILDRCPVPRGTRQVNFTPVEVVLCLAAMLLVNHRDYGSKTAHLASEPIQHLERLFLRPPTSILAKMANLDSSRSHGARAEKEAATVLLHDNAAGLFAVYEVVLCAARHEGIDEQALPDFLGVEHGVVRLIGQENLSDSDVESEVLQNAMDLADATGLDTCVTERLLVAVARVGQHRFSRNVLINCDRQCVFCGLDPGHNLLNRGLLCASHIKPWRSSEDSERLDVANGLTACPNHDTAFDRGLLYLTDSLDIRLSHVLARNVAVNTRLRESFGQPPISQTLTLPSQAVTPKLEYVRWHRQRIAAA